MNKLPEDVMYKNYVNHPIWKTSRSFKELFLLKGYTVNEFADTTPDFYRAIGNASISREGMILFVRKNYDRKLVSAFQKKIATFFDNWRSKEYYLRFEDEEGEQEVKVFKIYTANLPMYIIFNESKDVLKYLYVTIPQKKAPSFDKVFNKVLDSDSSDIKAVGLDEQIRRKRLHDLVRGSYESITKEDSKMMVTYENFLTAFEMEKKDESLIPAMVKTYYMLKDNMPSGWELALNLKENTMLARFNEPIIVNNAYVKDKITPLKLPLWIEKIYVSISSNGAISNVAGVGFHCDMAGGIMNAFKGICTGDISLNLRKHIQENDVQGAIKIFDNLPRQLSVTNLDHPHWQFSNDAIKVLADIQVIGYDPNEVDDMVITETPTDMPVVTTTEPEADVEDTAEEMSEDERLERLERELEMEAEEIAHDAEGRGEPPF